MWWHCHSVTCECEAIGGAVDDNLQFPAESLTRNDDSTVVRRKSRAGADRTGGGQASCRDKAGGTKTRRQNDFLGAEAAQDCHVSGIIDLQHVCVGRIAVSKDPSLNPN